MCLILYKTLPFIVDFYDVSCQIKDVIVIGYVLIFLKIFSLGGENGNA